MSIPLKRPNKSAFADNRYGHGGLGRGLVSLLNLFFILLIAQDLALVTWEVVWPTASMFPTMRKVQNSAWSTRPLSDTTLIRATQGLFGHNPTISRRPPFSPSLGEATDRPVPLILLGIYFTDGQASRALIGVEGKREKIYRIGDRAPNKAQVVAIYSDRVLLKRHQNYETLRLPQGNAQKTTIVSRGGTAYLSSQTNDEIKKIWDQFRKRPESILSMMRMEPAMQGGKFVGVQIFPGSDPQFLAQFGLQSGDVVTWVNGVELTDPLQGMAVLGQLASVEALHLRLQRGSLVHAFDFYRDGNAPQ